MAKQREAEDVKPVRTSDTFSGAQGFPQGETPTQLPWSDQIGREVDGIQVPGGFNIGTKTVLHARKSEGVKLIIAKNGVEVWKNDLGTFVPWAKIGSCDLTRNFGTARLSPQTSSSDSGQAA